MDAMRSLLMSLVAYTLIPGAYRGGVWGVQTPPPKFTPLSQWRTERGRGFGGFKPPRNSEDIGGVLYRMGKKNRLLNFLL